MTGGRAALAEWNPASHPNSSSLKLGAAAGPRALPAAQVLLIERDNMSKVVRQQNHLGDEIMMPRQVTTNDSSLEGHDKCHVLASHVYQHKNKMHKQSGMLRTSPSGRL